MWTPIQGDKRGRYTPLGQRDQDQDEWYELRLAGPGWGSEAVGR